MGNDGHRAPSFCRFVFFFKSLKLWLLRSVSLHEKTTKKEKGQQRRGGVCGEGRALQRSRFTKKGVRCLSES